MGKRTYKRYDINVENISPMPSFKSWVIALKDKYLDKIGHIPLNDIITQASPSIVEQVHAQDGKDLGFPEEFLFLRSVNSFSKSLDNSSSEALLW
jgi:hypothetical protein